MKLISPTLVFVVLLSWVDLAGKTLIFPPAALSDLVQLGPARIEVRWKPRSIPDGYFPAVEGYYVVYNHENLSLFFGPVSNEKEAIRTQNELAEIRRGLISKNPALSSSTVGRINIDFGGNPPTGQNDPPPSGLQPIRVYSGDSTLELGQKKEDAELGSSTTEGPASSTYGLPSTPESPEDIPVDGSDRAPESLEGVPADGSGSANSGTPQGVGNNESSLESSEGGSTPEGTSNGPEEGGILKILSQGTGTPEGSPGTDQATPGNQNQPPQGELEGTGTSTPTTHRETELPESGNSAGQSGQSQKPEMEPSPQTAEPIPDDAPEAIAPSESPTHGNQNQPPQGELDGSETSTPTTHRETELPESGNPAGNSGQNQDPEMAPSPETAEPATDDAPETLAPSESPTPTSPELDELENPPKTKAGSVHINQLLKGNL